ncbi:Uncharacterised protein r2_g2530 [Pycnogonum litorale]
MLGRYRFLTLGPCQLEVAISTAAVATMNSLHWINICFFYVASMLYPYRLLGSGLYQLDVDYDIVMAMFGLCRLDVVLTLAADGLISLRCQFFDVGSIRCCTDITAYF